MTKSWIDGVRVTNGQAMYNTEGIEPPTPRNWSPWARTFLFIPKKDIHGKYVFGPVWSRLALNAVHYGLSNQDVVYVYHKDIVEYCRSKKDIFMRELNGAAKD